MVFLKAQKTFNRVYFADLVGLLCGLTVPFAMYFYRPDDLIMALLDPVAGGGLWSWRWATGVVRLIVGRRDAVGCRGCITWRRPCSASLSLRCPTTRACPTPKSSRRQRVSTSGQRRSAISVVYSSSTCISPWAVGQRGLQPAHHAGQRHLGFYMDPEGRRASS